MTALTDWRGTDIAVGDTILYAVKHSCSVEVNEGIVSGFGSNAGWNGQAQPTIKVDWARSSGGWDQYRKIKQVTLTNTKHVTVIAKA